MGKIIRVLAGLIAVVLIGVSGYQLISIHSGYQAADTVYEEAVEQFVQIVTTGPTEPERGETMPSGETTPPTEPKEYAPISVDFEALWQVNPNVVGWIYCPDTRINYPIVQTGNNSDYLRRMLDGSYNYSGTIFLDYRNDGAFRSLNSIIYGHNMNNQGMFGTLEEYGDPAYYAQHPTFYLLTPERDYRVDLIGGLNAPADSELYNIYHTEESFRDFLGEVMASSAFDSGIDPEEITRTLTLSTCSYVFENARYLLVGSMTELDRPES